MGPSVLSYWTSDINFWDKLRRYATSRKVAGSIPDEVIFKFI
jgi:hypothetical protein